MAPSAAVINVVTGASQMSAPGLSRLAPSGKQFAFQRSCTAQSPGVLMHVAGALIEYRIMKLSSCGGNSEARRILAKASTNEGPNARAATCRLDLCLFDGYARLWCVSSKRKIKEERL